MEKVRRVGELKTQSYKERGKEALLCNAHYDVFVLPDAGFSPLLRAIESADEFLYVEEQYLEKDGIFIDAFSKRPQKV
jgi:hypothetical protein